MQTPESSAAYIPMDRRHAIAQGLDLPARTSGSTLFADVSGFTPLTETLVSELGPRRGAEELTSSLNAVYGALIAEVHRYGGSVVSFAGDAITCWFDGDSGLRAASCALTLQRVMQRFSRLETRSGSTVSLAIKAAVTSGSVRRFLIGDPQIQLLDVMAGSTLDRMARAEKHADKNEVLIGPQVISQVGDQFTIVERRDDPKAEEQFAVIGGLAPKVKETSLLRSWAEPTLTENQIQPWILPPIRERLRSGQGRFLAELRLAVALFVSFGGLDYDQDTTSGTKLDGYVRWVQNVLARYGGYLLQLITGDKGSYLYAAFGAPLAHDDDAVRAVAAAIDLCSLPPELSYIADVRIGISQGQMRAGAYGGPARRTYGVLGDEVTVAARLMGTAEPGQVLISKHIADAAAKTYRFRHLGSIELKGKRDLLPVYLPLERRLLSAQRPAALFKNPLVGRSDELAKMEQLLDQTWSGQGQILRLEGAAGVGKSHLAAEFVERAIDHGFRVALGICQSTTKGIAYAPWRQAFRALFDLAAGPVQGENLVSYAGRQIAQVEAIISQTNPEWFVRLPLLGDLLGFPIPDNETTVAFDPQLRQESLFALAVEVVRTWAQTQPILLLVEDAQWMDEASLGLTTALGRVITSEPVLLAVVQRPPVREGERVLPELETLACYHLLDLNVLSPEGVRELVTHRLQGPPSALALSLIQAQTDRNPLFIEELVDALRESGRLCLQGDRWELSETIVEALRNADCLTRDSTSGQWIIEQQAQLANADLGIPDSIHGIVLSRIDRLLDLQKLTIKVSSVIGRIFEFDLLDRSHPLHLDRQALLEQIRILEEREFTRLETPEPHLIYQFKHNITQEVVYQMLLEVQQRELHQAVAQSLEQLIPEAIERLAYHYSHSDARDKALLYLGQAAEKAQHEYANETALRYYSQALDLEERWQWRKGQVQVLHILGRRQEELAALDILEATPVVPIFDAAYLWGQYYEALGDYAQAQESIERAMIACQDCGDTVGQARCLSQLGLVARRQGDYERAKHEYNRALALYGEPATHTDSEVRGLTEILNGLGTVHRQVGAYENAQSCYERALELSRGRGDREGEADALSRLGGVADYQRRFSDALEHHRQALQVYRTIGDRAGEGRSLYDLAVGAMEAGDYGQAETRLSEALGIQQAIGNRWEQVNILNGLGVQHLELGDFAAAQDSLQQGLQLAREIGDAAGQAYLLINLGLAACERNDLKDADRQLMDGLELAERLDEKRLVAAFQNYLSIVDLRAGRFEQAKERAVSALDLWQELGAHLQTPDGLATLAAAHLANADLSEALEYARQTLDVLTECGGQGPEFPQRDYFVCHTVLSASGHATEADTALRAAYDLVLARANKLIDPSLRQSFLERVPMNRQIVQEAQRKGITY